MHLERSVVRNVHSTLNRMHAFFLVLEFTDEKKLSVKHFVSEYGLLRTEVPFEALLEGVSFTSPSFDASHAVIYELIVQGVRYKEGIELSNVSGTANFGTFSARGKVFKDDLNCTLSLQLDSTYISNLPFAVSLPNDLEPEYPIEIVITGSFQTPVLSVRSELFQFTLKKNV